MAFADLDVMGVGPVAEKVSAAFDLYWNSALAYPASALLRVRPTGQDVDRLRARLGEFVSSQESREYVDRLRTSKLFEQIREKKLELQWGRAEVVFDRPEKLLHALHDRRYHLAPMRRPHVKAIKRDLLIFSPYFVPGQSGVALLTELAARGVRVRVLTNSLASTDVPAVHMGYARYRSKLLRGGVELYEFNSQLSRKDPRARWTSSKAGLHAKSFVFDGRQVFIGSMSLDPRAMLHNTEIGVLLDVPALAQDMLRWFDAYIARIAFRLQLHRDRLGYEELRWHGQEHGQQVIHADEPQAGFGRRCGVCAIGLLPIESQL